MKQLRLTLLVGTFAGVLPLTAAFAAQPAETLATASPALLAQADAPPVPPEALERKKKDVQEKVRGRERGGDEGGKAERPSRAERRAPDDAKPEPRRAAPSSEEPAPRAERRQPTDEMKRKPRASEEAAPAPAPKAEKPAPAAPEARPVKKPEEAPKAQKVPESNSRPTARPDDSRSKAGDSDREQRRRDRDSDKTPDKTEKPATPAPTTGEEKAAPDKTPSGKASGDKATETERQIRGTDKDATERDRRGSDTRSGDRDGNGRDRNGADRDRGTSDRDRGDNDRRGTRDNDIRDEADYRDRNRDFDKRFDRREEREGNRVVIKEKGDRTIIREGGRTTIRHDEDDRLRRHARDVRTERRGDEMVTIIDRPNGVQIVTVTDRDGRLIRRSRRHNGHDVVLIDNRHSHRPDYNVYVELPPVRLGIPRDEYIVEADSASYDDIRGALIAPPVAPIQQNYTLDQVRSSVSLRERVRSVDLNTINFAFGDWQVPESQVGQLENIAKALSAIIEDNPDEVFLIEGHTDAVGSEIDNLSLSDRRAEEVAAALTQDYEIPPENLVTQGYGEQYLKVDTEEANADNRRVVVRRITPLLNAEAKR